MAKAMLGMPNILINGMKEAVPRIAVNTGLTRKGNTTPIYCILIPNPKYENGEKQKFFQNGFCCPDDGTQLGNWVSGHMPTEHEEEGASFAMLEEEVIAVKDSMTEIIPILKEYLDVVSAGRIPRDNIGKKIREFEVMATDFQEMYSEVWRVPYP